ncbi:MAG: hypothetical protein ACTSRG_04775 [Candidatus Helarchaeota archaeon]
MAVRINWRSAENISYIIFSLTVAGFVQFGVILFTYYFLPIVSPFILILVPIAATILNCGSAILLGEFMIQYRHRKIVQMKYKTSKRELTTGFSLVFSNLLVLGMFFIIFIGIMYFYILYVPGNQIRQIASGFLIPLTNVNLFDLPPFLSFMAANLGGAIPPFGLAIILDYLMKRPYKIRKKKI